MCTALSGLFPVLPHVLFSAVCNDSIMHGSGSVWERPGPGNIHHGSTSGTQGGHWDRRYSLILRLHSTRSFILRDSLWQPCMGDSYPYFRFCVLNEVESKLQECHIHLDREKATQKEKGVMSGVMLILRNLYVTRVLLPSLDHSEFRYHRTSCLDLKENLSTSCYSQ